MLSKRLIEVAQLNLESVLEECLETKCSEKMFETFPPTVLLFVPQQQQQQQQQREVTELKDAPVRCANVRCASLRCASVRYLSERIASDLCHLVHF